MSRAVTTPNPTPRRTRRPRRAGAGTIPRLRRDSPDAGFSLVEAVVALALLAIVVTATAAWVLNASQATRLAHQDAQVADILQNDLEKARAASYSTVAMSSPLPTGDPLLVSSSGTTMAVLGVERSQHPVLSVAGTTVLPHVESGTFNGTPYRLTRYVTLPSTCAATTTGSEPPCRRYSAVVTWTSGNQTRARWASELLTKATRAVAEDWSWTVPGGTSVRTGTGGKVVVPYTLLNNGNRNSWSLTATVKNGSGTVVAATAQWYLDANGDGVWQSATETYRLDQAAAGTGQSGSLESGRLLRCLAVVTVPAGSYTVTARSTSLMERRTSATQASFQDVSAAVTVS